jgi:heme A synthase
MIHKPSYAPVLMAAGLMCALWGAVTTWLISALGLVVVAIASVRWIRDAGQAEQATAAPQMEEPAARAPVRREAFGAPGLRRASPWLHRFAILVALGAFALVVTGALVTSNDPQPSVFLQRMHLTSAASVGILAAALGLWLRGAGWILLAAVVVEALLGGRSPAVGALHAFLAQLFLAGTVGIALITSKGWLNAPELVADSARFSLRRLSLTALPLVILQVALGAAYRHKVMGVMPHIIGALVVTLALLLLAVLVTNQYPEHRALRPAAKFLIGITFTQVMLGMGAFITRLMMAEGTIPVVIISVAHVATGSLTLASTAVLTLLIRRYLTAG